MNILFISRAYPPVIGGIERQNHEIGKALASITRTDIIANTWGKWLLPVFLPYALFKALLNIRNYDAVLLGDGVLGILGYLLKSFSRIPVACIVHGLDLTYQNRLYQKLWIQVFLQRLDKLIAVGNATIHQGMLRGLPESKFIFIPNGVAVSAQHPCTRQDLENLLHRKIDGRVILTLGRLVRRKGVAWFIGNVMNQLGPDVTYIIAGEGREQPAILAAIQANNLQERVLYVGGVSDREKQLLFCTADIFVQPNIEVAGDMEGFGLVVLEAAMHGLVVIASDIEGLKDAIQDGQNGFLVATGDAGAYRRKIQEFLKNPGEKEALGMLARDYVIKNYAWPLIARRYLDVLSTLRRERQT
ncbi:MAG TPA: glycosyltransferase family 4 protein [Gammaproteobacteria bacterium]|nr:glycosyltransferase family 4 protein [Gammaproteobacteria bacterium]